MNCVAHALYPPAGNYKYALLAFPGVAAKRKERKKAVTKVKSAEPPGSEEGGGTATPTEAPADPIELSD